jgi:rare lipoprotein A
MFRRLRVRVAAFGTMLACTACAPTTGKARPPAAAPTTHPEASHEAAHSMGGTTRGAADQVGFATWYGNALAGRKTANGERFDPSKFTAAHRTLPFGTWVEVRRVDTGRVVRVRITDRGPFSGHGRIIDLSKKAASELDMIRDGVTKVELRVVAGP